VSFDLSQAIATNDRAGAAEHAALAEAQRQHVIELFPVAAWPTMTVEQYALGTDQTKDSYCYELEFRSTWIGSVRGGSAYKHVIFRRRSNQQWRYPQQFSDLEWAWSALRSEFVQAFELADQSEWDAIDALPLLTPSLRSKSVWLHHPDDLLPIYSEANLRAFCELLDLDPTGQVMALNQRLLLALHGRGHCEGWSTWELMDMLYKAADPRPQQRIVKIAPGHNAEYWVECLAGKYICVGWDEVGDLGQFADYEEMRDSFREQYADRYKGNLATVTQKSKELWTLRELRAGDLILANKGTKEVLAVGIVKEPGYEWSDGRKQYRHTVAVDWDTSRG
jgi:5-methylcytosine-specific restriction enzyme B